MPSISSLVNKLRSDFKQFTFTPGDDFHWSPTDNTIYYMSGSNDVAALLHETAHAVLGHRSYTKDIALLEMEREAWAHASRQLGPAYQIVISEDAVETSIDTYRDWLHARSTCPKCQAIGIQTDTHQYRCVACHEKWRVNDARICALRRYKIA